MPSFQAAIPYLCIVTIQCRTPEEAKAIAEELAECDFNTEEHLADIDGNTYDAYFGPANDATRLTEITRVDEVK